MKNCNATVTSHKQTNGSIAYCTESIRQVVALSLRRSNAKNINGDNKRYSNAVSNGSQIIRVAEYSGRMLEPSAA